MGLLTLLLALLLALLPGGTMTRWDYALHVVLHLPQVKQRGGRSVYRCGKRVHGEDLNAETNDKEYGAAVQHHAVNRVVPGAA